MKQEEKDKIVLRTDFKYLKFFLRSIYIYTYIVYILCIYIYIYTHYINNIYNVYIQLKNQHTHLKYMGMQF